MKATTQQIITKISTIKDYIDSEIFKNLVKGQDISSLSTPYRYNDDTLQDALDKIQDINKLITVNKSKLDLIGFDQRNNLIANLANFDQWLLNGQVLSYYQTIIQYTFIISQALFQCGFTTNKIPNTGELKKAVENLEKANITEREIEELKKLRIQLNAIIEANKDLNKAEEVLKLIQIDGKVQEAVNFAEKNNSKVEEINSKSEQLYKSITKIALYDDFDKITTKYEKDKKWWKYAVLASIIVLLVNVIFAFKLTGGVPIFLDWLNLAGNLLIKTTINTPSILLIIFTSRNYSRTSNLLEEYEFKAATSSTILGFGHSTKEFDATNISGKLVGDTLEELFKLPRRNINDFKHHNNDLIDLSQAVELVKCVVEKLNPLDKIKNKLP